MTLFFLLPFIAKAQSPIDLTPFQVANGWYVINGGLDISPANFIASYKQNWGLNNQDGLHLVKTETDTLGYTHYRYTQRYNAYKVEHTDFYLHYKDSLLVEANAITVPNLTLNTTPQITEATALNNALAYLNAQEYAWQNANMQTELRESTGDSTATYYPEGELLLARLKGENLQAQNFRFAYKFEIVATIPYQNAIIYVDAITGVVFQEEIHTIADRRDGRGDINAKGFTNKCDVINTCTTLYNGEQEITVIKRIFGLTDHILRECERNIRTTKGGDDWSMWDVKNGSSNWGTNEQWSTSAHWATEKAYDYFKNTFGRKGINGNGRRISVDAVNLPNYESFYDFNSYRKDTDNIRIGKHSGYPQPTIGQLTAFPPSWNTSASHASLDKIGHIYTLGVVSATANLAKGNIEAGALLVSFGDIFGTMIERHAQNGTFDWTIGEDTGIIERNMETPGALQHPFQYLGSFWVYQPNNYNGLLTSEQAWAEATKKNAGVQNRWFYLLAMGGNGVQGIGIEKAAKIAYRNLTTKLQQNSNFPQARTGAIQAAIELFGECSIEVAQVRNAWAAVGVGQPNNNVCFLMSSGGRPCRGIITMGFDVSSNLGLPITWTISPTLPYTTSGQYNEHIAISVPFELWNLTVTATIHDYANQISYQLSRNVPFKDCTGTKDEFIFLPTAPEQDNIIYPNPTKGITTIDLGTDLIENATLQVLNTHGVQVAHLKLQDRITNINLSAFPAGLYFLHVSNNNKRKIHKIQVVK